MGPRFLCLFLKISFSLQKEEDKNKQKTTQNTISKLKTGPMMLRNILGPMFNLDLDQFSTLKMCYFVYFY